MNAKMLLAPLALVVSLSLAGSAQAGMVAGWDFSQYFGAGFLTTDGANGTNTLSANYSDSDPTAGAGAESAAFGTMYMNGDFGSTNVNPLSPTAQFIPTSGSLTTNTSPGMGAVPFDSSAELLAEGQMFFNLLSMTATDALSVVFQADLSSISATATNWVLSLAGQTFSGVSNVGLDFSTDGMNFVTLADLNLTATDTAFSVNLGAGPSAAAYVRLNFDAPLGGGENQAIIDNLAISADLAAAPEPAALALLGMTLMAFAGVRRRRA